MVEILLKMYFMLLDDLKMVENVLDILSRDNVNEVKADDIMYYDKDVMYYDSEVGYGNHVDNEYYCDEDDDFYYRYDDEKRNPRIEISIFLESCGFKRRGNV